MEGECKCFHHSIVKVIFVLMWFSAIGFWWASAFKQTFLWIDSTHFFMDVVILALLMITSKYCGCCGWHRMSKMCTHQADCK